MQSKYSGVKNECQERGKKKGKNYVSCITQLYHMIR